MSGYGDLLYEARDGIVTITVNRPERHNALRIVTYEELADALERAGADATTGVVVITGAGERAFCSGGDVTMAQTMLTGLHSARHHFMHRMMRVSTLMTDLGAPVICKVNGLCVGGGAELMLFSDVVIAAEHAYFAFNGTDIGGCSWWGAPQLLPLMVGLRRAEEILYESRRVTAAEAERIGLITRCVAKDRLDAEVEERCQLILDLSAEGLRLTKAALRATRAQVLSTMTTAAETNAAAVAGPELHRAFDAFLAGERMDWRSLRPAANTNSKSDSEKNSDKEQEA